MDKRFIDFYMDVARRTALLSRAVRLQVGAIIVKDDKIISLGYNGTPKGWSNECEIVQEDGTLKTKPEVLHAESNSLAKLARSTESGLDADLFVTHSPCLDCAKLIFQSGIKRVFYANAYRDNAGLDFLQASGVEVQKIDV